LEVSKFAKNFKLTVGSSMIISNLIIINSLFIYVSQQNVQRITDTFMRQVDDKNQGRPI